MRTVSVEGRAKRNHMAARTALKKSLRARRLRGGGFREEREIKSALKSCLRWLFLRLRARSQRDGR